MGHLYTTESSRLYLQPLSVEKHLEVYHAQLANPAIARWSHRPPSKSLSESQTLMESRLWSKAHPYMENYAILLKNTPEEEGHETNTSLANERVRLRMIGSIGIPRLSGDGKSAEVGYGILPSYWGKGYATEALSLFTAYYWNSDRPVQTETIQAVVEPENTASMRVLSKAGFKKGELNEKAYEVDDLEGGGKRWVRAYPFYLERPAASEALE